MELHNYTTVKIKSWTGQDGVTWIEPEVNSGHIIAKIVSGNDPENARRIVAAWNYCAGVPTSELEANGATAGFWGRACARLKGKNDKLKAENAALRAAVAEMQRMLPVIEYFENGDPLENDGDMTWADAVLGTGITTANAYRQALETALEKINENK